MTIQVGDKIPAATLKSVTPDGPKDITTDELFRGKKVVLFAVPGAFTPACSQRHLPGFVDKAAGAKAKSVGNKIMILADASGHFARAGGPDIDLSRAGLGTRSKRYSMLVEDGT